MTQLFAQPYNIDATGFYFETLEEFTAKSKDLKCRFGEPVEEFEIQFIDGDGIDCDLAEAIGLYQSNIGQFFDAVEAWDTQEKTTVILAVGACGYRFDATTQPSDFDVEIHHVETLRALAEQFVDEGLFGDIPEHLTNYIDLDAIARDLAVEYAETEIAGKRMIYRAA